MSRDYDVQRVDTGLEMYCAVCLLDELESWETEEAVAIVRGTSTCREHVKRALALASPGVCPEYGT